MLAVPALAPGEPVAIAADGACPGAALARDRAIAARSAARELADSRTRRLNEGRHVTTQSAGCAARSAFCCATAAWAAARRRSTLDVERDYWGQENCTDILTLSRPDLVRDIHRGYFEAGADMVETNTFGASPVTLGEFGLADRAFEINKTAGELAREAAESVRRRPPSLRAGQHRPRHQAADPRQHRL